MQAVKSSVAMILAWFIAQLLVPGELPVLAAATALLVVQPSINQSLSKAIGRSVGVLFGVLLAYGLGILLGKSSWIVLVAIVLCIMLSWAFRLSPGSANQIPISAMLVLSVGATTPNYAFERVIETIIGAVVALLVNVIIVPPVALGPAQKAVSAVVDEVANAFDFPGFVPAYIRPLFCRGVGPFRWVALSGDAEDIYKTDAKVKELIADDAHLHNWLDMARERISFQGLPARICWVGLGQRAKLGLAFNEMVRSGELSAPIVIGRDHLDSGSVASPNRETESMQDGSDAVSDWPLLNALLNTASGATWVSLHHGGGVGMGFSQHSGMVIVCDGTDEAAERIAAAGVLRNMTMTVTLKPYRYSS